MYILGVCRQHITSPWRGRLFVDMRIKFACKFEFASIFGAINFNSSLCFLSTLCLSPSPSLLCSFYWLFCESIWYSKFANFGRFSISYHKKKNNDQSKQQKKLDFLSCFLYRRLYEMRRTTANIDVDPLYLLPWSEFHFNSCVLCRGFCAWRKKKAEFSLATRTPYFFIFFETFKKTSILMFTVKLP